MNNSLMIIYPYYQGTWVFDDDNVGLVREPFVSGIPQIIDTALITKGFNLQECRKGISITFSGNEFPDYDILLEKLNEEYGGTWYVTIIKGIEYTGWLCPALLRYFDKSPDKLYAKFELNNK